MVFLPIICLALSIAFYMWARHHHSTPMQAMAVCLLFAALGTGLITFFALTTLK